MMLLRWMLVLASAIACSAGLKTDGFYVVSLKFSDGGPTHQYRVLEVRADGRDSVVRYLQVSMAGSVCPRTIVQSVERRLTNVTPAKLSGGSLCGFTGKRDLAGALPRYGRPAGIFESTSFGIVADCGNGNTSPATLALPFSESVDMVRLAREHPAIARLWKLMPEIAQRSFGAPDAFSELNFQQEVPGLASGRYDTGLRAAWKAAFGSSGSENFALLLKNYRGPVLGAAEWTPATRPRLIGSGQYQFARYVDPAYPPLALQARVQGAVEMTLTVDSVSGAVKEATVATGHPLLVRAALEAAKQWRFVPESLPVESFNVTLDFGIRCP